MGKRTFVENFVLGPDVGKKKKGNLPDSREIKFARGMKLRGMGKYHHKLQREPRGKEGLLFELVGGTLQSSMNWHSLENSTKQLGGNYEDPLKLRKDCKEKMQSYGLIYLHSGAKSQD